MNKQRDKWMERQTDITVDRHTDTHIYCADVKIMMNKKIYVKNTDGLTYEQTSKETDVQINRKIDERADKFICSLTHGQMDRN